MKAVVQRHYGGTDQLEVTEVEAPRPGPDEVLVRVRAAAVDRGTWHLMTGLPLVGRPFLGVTRPRTAVIGRDLAGVVEAVGEGVTSFRPGDEVIGTAAGSCAELALVPTKRLARKPSGLTFEEAAALPVSGLTALQAVRDAGRVGPGQQVLVIGASGGVGTYAVQIAAAYGAEVTGVCSGSKSDLVRGLGAARVIDYTREEIDHDGRRYDVVLDIAGNRPLRLLRRVLTDTGTLVIVGGEGGGRWFGGLQRQLGALAWSPFLRQRLTSILNRENGADLEVLADLVEAGSVRPAIDRSFALEEAAEALGQLEAGQVRGKVTLTV